ncbi:MAG: hypothetical protein ACE144_12670 [Thermodesulfobacteriota bacterium]
MNEKEYVPFENILGIVDHDLYVPELNFAFDEASQRAAVISLARLRQESPEWKPTDSSSILGSHFGCVRSYCFVIFEDISPR